MHELPKIGVGEERWYDYHRLPGPSLEMLVWWTWGRPSSLYFEQAVLRNKDLAQNCSKFRCVRVMEEPIENADSPLFLQCHYKGQSFLSPKIVLLFPVVTIRP